MSKGNKGGRPSTYKPEYCDQIIEFMGLGHSMKAFAAHIGVHSETIHQWGKKNPEFAVAIKKGKERCQLWWEKLGMALATGHKSPAGHDYRRGNPTVFIWMTKNLLGWSDKLDINEGVEPIVLRIKGEKGVYEIGTGTASETGKRVEKR
jgi:hypothetical protein